MEEGLSLVKKNPILEELYLLTHLPYQALHPHHLMVQKVVSEKELREHLNKGWSVNAVVSPQSIVLEKPLDLDKILAGFRKVIEEERESALKE